MNINNFEEYINSVILERGKNYYKCGNVLSVESDGEKYEAVVSGSEDYYVTAAIDENGEIFETACDCPYDFGNICKHQIAVFYAIQENYNDYSNFKNNNKGKNLKKNLKDSLNQLEKSSLIKIILDMTSKNPQLKNVITAKLSDDDDIIKTSRKLIKTCIKKAAHYGFVEYGDVDYAVEGATTVVSIAKEKAEDNSETAVKLCMLVHEEMIDLIANCDDSNGIVGGIIDDATMLIHQITENEANKFPVNTQDENYKKANEKASSLFSIILDNVDNARYDGWSDFKFDIINTCLPLCHFTNIRNNLEQYLDDISPRNELKSFSNEYNLRVISNLKYNIISKFDGEDAGRAFINNNLFNSDFRKLEINNLIAEKNFERALQLCSEGEIQDMQYAGLLNQWKHLRYSIYEHKEDKENQKKLGMEFVSEGKFEYFKKLKLLYNNNEWNTVVLPNILEITKKNQRYGNTYVNIIVHENLEDKILEYCMQNKFGIVSLYPHIINKFKDDVNIIFLEHINHEALRASDRRRYKEICEIIKHYSNACGKEQANNLRNDMMTEHKKRPAFVDELKKMKI